jgi:hypothetical protein
VNLVLIFFDLTPGDLSFFDKHCKEVSFLSIALFDSTRLRNRTSSILLSFPLKLLLIPLSFDKEF